MGRQLSNEFATTAAYAAAAVFVSTIPFCFVRRQWPELTHLVAMLLSISGTMAGLKIALLTLFLADAQLGMLANDKLMLLIGGFTTLVLSLRAATASWRKVANV